MSDDDLKTRIKRLEAKVRELESRLRKMENPQLLSFAGPICRIYSPLAPAARAAIAADRAFQPASAHTRMCTRARNH
jgi:hypothetical protein